MNSFFTWQTIVAILATVLFAWVIAYFWGKGIDKMNEEHPDYKGDDFLN